MSLYYSQSQRFLNLTLSTCCDIPHCLRMGCAYMYKCTILNTTRFKAVMTMIHQNSTVKRASARVVPGWVTSWEVCFEGAKSGQYCVVGVGRYTCDNAYSNYWS
jgi:hypothetical protein